MSGVVFTPRGPFSLAAGLGFLEGFAPAPYQSGQDRTLRLAFPSDDGCFTVTAAVQQDETTVATQAGTVRAEVTLHSTGTHGAAPASSVVGEGLGEKAAADVARILSLDVDATRFIALGSTDPVVGGLVDEFPGLRPVCFNSPYEAAAWAVIGSRVRMSHAAAVKRLLAQRHGHRVAVAGQELSAFPAPPVLQAITSFPGLTKEKIRRLHAVAEAAIAGELDPARLRALPAREALAALQELPGIGPFSAELVLIRGAGHPDHFPRHEPRLHAAMADAYTLKGQAAGVPALARIAERWAPYRSWVALLLRAHADPGITAIRNPKSQPGKQTDHARGA
ncbi:DNA-3-methyladenine glycosylase 2 [Streptomyces xantholiticus]|uniref:DNA-3-methyladenine glycosylase 2 n=1 Tax=Streptomyces xantholiticus TaxID=68285 RepID=UPI0019945A43|nr:DNA-3-methyladenine glycosylase 2 family protein [Streptomyces xantholiticus]GGW65462.1 DNA-3-methyladenine glycosylase II [Streptomyces xantholiticus]